MPKKKSTQARKRQPPKKSTTAKTDQQVADILAANAENLERGRELNKRRPTKYRPEFCEIAIELGRQGKSRTGIAAHLLISKDTLYEWANQHPEFSDALKRARVLEQEWWEQAGQVGINLGKEFNASAYNKIISNRFRDDYGEAVPPPNTPGAVVQNNLFLFPATTESVGQFEALAAQVMQAQAQRAGKLREAIEAVVEREG